MDALTKYRECKNTIQLVLIDCGMPKMNGEQAVFLMREHESANGWREAVAVGITGEDRREYIQMCKT